MAWVVLLGPQRFDPTVRQTIDALGIEGSIAVISAGWQEREAEDQELGDHLARPVVDLMLYRRYDDLRLRDRSLAAALEERQALLQRHQELYRMRLDHALAAARQLMHARELGPVDALHRREAIRALRALDAGHLRRLAAVHREFAERTDLAARPVVVRHRDQLAKIIERSAAVAIAGGNVAVLINRMRLFDLPALVGRRPIVAWSAGAMAVSERIVLFHDNPPQGAGNPEVFDAGLELCRGVLPLPHARRRLRLQDPVRVALFARRFEPAVAVALDPGARLSWDGSSWTAGPATMRLTSAGRLAPLEVA
jgi:hypothetical protein